MDLNIVFKIINTTICFFNLLLVFLMSIFDIRRYGGAYLSCASRLIILTTHVDESIEKNEFPANTAVLKPYLNSQEKNLFNQKYVYRLL